MQSACKACNAVRYAANAADELAKRSTYYRENSEKIKAREATRYAQNSERIKARVKSYYHQNKDRVRAYNATYSVSYRAKNQDKIQAWRKAWCEANPHKLNAQWMRRKAIKMRATPKWADQQKIDEFYFAADFLSMITGEWHEVDHVIPMGSKNVCGLHVHTNLQILTRTENRRKGHYTWPDMP
jgi:hypothetical protein